MDREIYPLVKSQSSPKPHTTSSLTLPNMLPMVTLFMHSPSPYETYLLLVGKIFHYCSSPFPECRHSVFITFKLYLIFLRFVRVFLLRVINDFKFYNRVG